jgi:predicted ATPase
MQQPLASNVFNDAMQRPRGLTPGTHAEALITALEATPGCRLLRLERELGATVLPGQTVLERAAWRWPG